MVKSNLGFPSLLTLVTETTGPSTWIVPRRERVVGSSWPEYSPESQQLVEAIPGSSKQTELASTTASKDEPAVTGTQSSTLSVERGKRALDNDGDEDKSVKKAKANEEIGLGNKVENRARRVSNSLSSARIVPNSRCRTYDLMSPISLSRMPALHISPSHAQRALKPAL